MTDHTFPDDDVIKALECCDENDCYLCCYRIGGVDCRDRMQKDALALINRQKAEIERLHKENTELLVSATTELHIPMEIAYRVRTAHPIFKEIRSEAYKEFAERLKALKIKPEFPWDDFVVTEGAIDDLVKEMTEEHNESQNT